MPPPVADDDHKRRARRRLIGAVALTIIAVIILPLVLEDEPPPAGPLEVHMPPPALEQKPVQNAVEPAPSSANSLVASSTTQGAAPAGNESDSERPEPPKAIPVPAKPVAQQAKEIKTAQNSVAFAVQVGVFADKANVQKLQARIAALGLKSYTDDVDGGTRVRVGSFSDRTAAEATSAKLATAGIKGQVVEK
jgi:DedD protein